MPDGTESEGVVIGVDLGGTKVAAGLVDPPGRITTRYPDHSWHWYLLARAA
jgi:hypothetical protein